MRKNALAYYAWHSRWTNPGAFAPHLQALPPDFARLPQIVGGLVLHPLFAGSGARASLEPALRTIPEILGALLRKDSRALREAREPRKRVLGTCRSYALLACAILRERQVPARLRVGFADYFTPGFNEDHWVCEYLAGDHYRLLDTELTSDVCRRFGVAFDPADVPRERFLTAARAWQKLRSGERSDECFGVSALRLGGAWFVAGSLLRDLAALGMDEMMPWDYWGPAREFRPGSAFPPGGVDNLDGLADALAREPASYGEVQAIVAELPWAALPATILSFPAGEPIEVRIAK